MNTINIGKSFKNYLPRNSSMYTATFKQNDTSPYISFGVEHNKDFSRLQSDQL